MELIIEIAIYIVVAILIGICAAWIYLIKSMIETFTLTPYLDKFENTNNTVPKVSIILPARNEEKYLANCLDSLIDQDYQNYEIVVIDDTTKLNDKLLYFLYLLRILDAIVFPPFKKMERGRKNNHKPSFDLLNKSGSKRSNPRITMKTAEEKINVI